MRALPRTSKKQSEQMKQIILTFLVTVFVGCGGPSTPGNSADESSSTLKDPFADWQSEHKEMVEVLQLSAADSESLKKEFEKHVTIFNDWNSEHGEEYVKTFRDVMGTAKTKNLSKLRKISPKAQELRKAYLKILDDRETGVINALSKVNRDKWRGMLISNHFFKLADQMEFSDSQKASIKEIAVHSASRTANEKNPKAAGFIEFEKQVERAVLDRAQRDQYKTVKENNKMRPSTF